jgi:hypothetical protein
MRFLLPLLLFTTAGGALALERDLSGNVEVQSRRVWNNEEAKTLPFFPQRWEQENFHLIYGNLTGKLTLDETRLEANWFGRHSVSELYQNNYLATNIYTFPNRLVARDLFKLQHRREGADYTTESVLNKFIIERSLGKHRVSAGRLYINYGIGEIFNPMNPFNQPTALTAASQVAQGNDGAMVKLFLTDSQSVDVILLGDKSFEGYDGSVTRTLWLHGELQYSDKVQLDYVLGEDQQRRKYGGQMTLNHDDYLYFIQALYSSALLDGRPSSNLWDLMLGFDRQFTALWHLRLEAGYQKENRFPSANFFGERFLPTEYFVALANQYELHPLLKLSGTVINDIKSGFTYLLVRATYSVRQNTELEVFGNTPVGQGDAPDNLAQRIVTRDLGVALRAFF